MPMRSWTIGEGGNGSLFAVRKGARNCLTVIEMLRDFLNLCFHFQVLILCCERCFLVSSLFFCFIFFVSVVNFVFLCCIFCPCFVVMRE